MKTSMQLTIELETYEKEQLQLENAHAESDVVRIKPSNTDEPLDTQDQTEQQTDQPSAK